MYLEDSIYDDIEAIYKEYQEPEAKNGNCLCYACCEEIKDGDVMKCQKCGHLKHSDDVEYVPSLEFSKSYEEGDDLELNRDFCFKCAEIVRAENPEDDSTSEEGTSSDAEEAAAEGPRCECCMCGWGVHLKSGRCRFRECDLCERLFRAGTFCGTCGEVW
jgi:hypothetical protein